MSELPKGWLIKKLQEVATVNMGQSPKGEFVSESQLGLPFYQGKSEFGKLFPSPRKWCSKPTKIAEKNDILMSIRAPVGPTNYCPEQSCIGRGLSGIRANDSVEQSYLFYFFKSIEPWLSQQGTGSTFKAISGKFLREIDVVVAPIDEQKRIVDKLDKMLEKVEAAQARLDKIPTILKRFRQSVLAAATSGELTKDWREENYILREQSISGKFKIDFEVIKEVPIPKTWSYVPLGNFAKCARGKFSIRPRNDPSCFDGEYPFIQIGDLPREGGYISSHKQTLNQKGFSVSREFEPGTVVMAIVGATIAITGITAYPVCFPDSLVGINSPSDVENIYIDYVLRAYKEDIRQASYAGGGQPNIKLTTINPLPLPLPPKKEIVEIVARVGRLFEHSAVVEKQYIAAKTRINKLTQSILAKAFRGELLDANENDQIEQVIKASEALNA